MENFCQWLHEQLEVLPMITFPFGVAELPDNGIYFFYEKGEFWGHGENKPRIVRVGINRGQDNFISRIKEHFLLDESKIDFNNKMPKPSDRSIFRKNLGNALLNMDKDDYLKVWKLDFMTREHRDLFSHKRNINKEKGTETRITKIIRKEFSFRYICVDDQEKRMGLEARLIGTLASCPLCQPSPGWLGNHSPEIAKRKSRLWQVQHLKDKGLTEEDKEDWGRC